MHLCPLDYNKEIIMNNHKTSFGNVAGFAIVATLGIVIDHDSYHALLAVAAGMLACFMAMNLIRGNAKRVFFFIFMTIAFAQTSVVAKRAIMDEGFKKTLSENPLGVLVADVWYGCLHVYFTICETFEGVYNSVVLSDFSTLEQLNYRFLTVFIMFVLLIPKIAFTKDVSPQRAS